jgi:outer membrane lipoprotein-sorting protein
MRNRFWERKLVLPAVVLALVVFFGGAALASEFSADLTLSGTGMAGQGKVYVKGQKMRQEFGDSAGKMIVILDLDKGYNYMLMPDQKMYMKVKVESKGQGFHPENFVGMQQGNLKSETKKVGTEKIMGYKCDKYLIEFENKQMGTMTMWFATDLGFPVKSEGKGPMGKMVQELSNIKKGAVSDSLFAIPSGYQEMQMPAMPKQ